MSYGIQYLVGDTPSRGETPRIVPCKTRYDQLYTPRQIMSYMYHGVRMHGIRRGLAVGQRIDRPWTDSYRGMFFTEDMSWASHRTSCGNGHELPCHILSRVKYRELNHGKNATMAMTFPGACTMGQMPRDACIPWYVTSVTRCQRCVPWCNMGHIVGCRMVSCMVFPSSVVYAFFYL